MRITVQGKREAKACKQIREKLFEKVGNWRVSYSMIAIVMCFCAGLGEMSGMKVGVTATNHSCSPK